MTKLSVNINKVATLRNARGGNNPDVIKVAQDCERFGAQGITVHPRPDERHIRYQDVMDLQKVVTTEFNIEGNPNGRFLELVKKIKPTQVTLVPDAEDVLTSDTGWDTIKYEVFLTETIAELKSYGMRTSIFINPAKDLITGAAKVGADRIEFYTGPYAEQYSKDCEQAIEAYVECAKLANSLGLGINAGHDLDLTNLQYLKHQIPALKEVSIGHALICDALYYGLENTIQMYLRELQ
ncbi:pyridoxine 5'-phosphate synthase [Microscilla marina]|uniref:Pyridoxine 5'-phosphate synthase n=1 Tax=Microscilla marina ATCC 23134 TaxID=313606 RepID=A1ZP25_MICM2|nr:pyridoxine 5'-phosphate synthase [Microscilla marina]EAY27817.1 pyridoxal phosphate biosynthetic protein PdxJ [Microscilla marina ATCC 23134]